MCRGFGRGRRGRRGGGRSGEGGWGCAGWGDLTGGGFHCFIGISWSGGRGDGGGGVVNHFDAPSGSGGSSCDLDSNIDDG